LAVDIVLTLTSKQKQNQQTKQATEQVETYSTEKLASKAKQQSKQASKHLQQQYTPYVCTTGNYRASVSICSSSFKNSLCL
jgi:predicted S18 family serine protease